MAEESLVHSVRVKGPATHVIVIGVGDYPHLVNGSGPLTNANDQMTQLTAPPLSARAIAGWLISNLNDPDKPLATVSLLLSESQPSTFQNPRTRATRAVPSATMENVEPAIREWFGRGNSQLENRLLFYFSGHGTARGSDVALLLADYGATVGNALEGAIDFGEFVQGMNLCKARQQVFLVDACRSNSDMLIGTYRGKPIYSLTAWEDIPTELRQSAVFYSSIAGAAAYGRPNQVSPFAEAVIRALSGAASDDIHGEKDWRVNTARLQEALSFYMEHAVGPWGPRALVPAANDLTTFEIHRLRGKPVATAVVQCVPKEATALAKFKCWSGGKLRDERPPGVGEWLVQLPVGTYKFTAEFADRNYKAGRASARLRPVYRPVELKVRP
jgi:hypothetical protein